MALLPGYPEGSNISILNASYHKSEKDENTDKWSDDFMTVIFKDLDSGKKNHDIIYKPKYRYYVAKEGVEITHNMLYIGTDKVYSVECPYRDLLKSIAENTGNIDFYNENRNTGNYKANKLLNIIPTVFSSDVDIEDHYRARFAQDYTNIIVPINKGYLDIEVDTKPINGEFPQLGECPINAITYIDDKTNSANIFLLRDINGDNPQIAEFENMFKNEKSINSIFSELKQFVIDNVGGAESAKKFKVDDLKFQFMFFDTEEKLLIQLFRLINHNSPDFMLAWNMAFDIPYIIERIKYLGLDPAVIMSSSSYVEKYATYFIDEQHKNDYELRGDYYDIAADTIYLDQLIQFASRRKGQAAFPNFKLDTAAEIITKGAVRKLDYSHITTKISELPYLNYKIFVFYNIMDVIAQKCIEESVQDIDYIYNACTLNDTRYSKAHRQTVYLANRARKYFFSQGYIMGNNVNIRNGEGEKYPGAIVGDPTKNSNYSKIIKDGVPLNLVDNCDDFDFKSLYPSLTRENNTASDNIIGKILIPDKIHDLENPYHDSKYDRGGQFIEDLVTGNTLEFGKRWLHLASIREMMDDINEYFTQNIPSMPTQIYNQNGMIKPFTIYQGTQGSIKPFVILEEGEMVKPFYIYDESQKDLINTALGGMYNV
jgi:DNA polymerase elongation subunit (family B)